MKIRSDASDAFYSHKCSRPIPHCDGLVKDLLVQLTLNSRVLRIGYLGMVSIEGRSIEVGAITIDRIDGQFVVDLEFCRRLRTPDEDDLVRGAIKDLGYRTLTITGADIQREPRFGSARAIWSYRRFTVGLPMRVALARALTEGSMSLHELCSTVTGPQDPITAILALVCAGDLDIDLTEWADGETIVRSRS